MNQKKLLINAATAFNSGDLDKAQAISMYIVKKYPNASDAWQILSVCALEKNNRKQALMLINKAIFINPWSANYYNIRGNILKKAHYYSKAIEDFKNAIKISPSSSIFHYNLGVLYQEIGYVEQAKKIYKLAYSLDPNNHKALINLGVVFRDSQEYKLALEQYDTLLKINPKHHHIIYAKGLVYKHKQDFKTATNYYKQAIALDTKNEKYHFSLSLAHLQEGNFIDGWREYEYRLQLPPFKTLCPKIETPRWRGEFLKKKESLLLWTEQGFGDSLTFIRYLPLISKRCSTLHLLCHAELKTLFSEIPGISSISTFQDKIPNTSYQLPLLSTPYLFHTTRETIPNAVPYLPSQNTIPLNSHTFNVGIVWKGKPIPDKGRSCNLEDFIPLFHLPGITFYSLQLEKKHSALLKQAPFLNYPITDLSVFIKDFKDTAALLTSLDLLISIDTAIVHLAGALNCPTWVLLQRYVDWRWQPEKDTSDWYPSHRLFRQKEQGQWNTVFESVKKALKQELEKINEEKLQHRIKKLTL